jgi:serine/threonine protein kinase
MTVVPGTRLGSYEVLAQIGAGGMGEVYRARDTKLQRDVALKILPAIFAANPERMTRFQFPQGSVYPQWATACARRRSRLC